MVSIGKSSTHGHGRMVRCEESTNGGFSNAMLLYHRPTPTTLSGSFPLLLPQQAHSAMMGRARQKTWDHKMTALLKLCFPKTGSNHAGVTKIYFSLATTFPKTMESTWLFQSQRQTLTVGIEKPVFL